MPSTVGIPKAAEMPDTVRTPTTHVFSGKFRKTLENDKISMKKSKETAYF
jgi:hypothetical protein